MLSSITPRYVVIGVETTGLAPYWGDCIIEVGTLALEGDVIIDEFSSLVNAHRRISAYERRINGITDAMLKGKPGAADIFPALCRLIKDATIVAHNAKFDMGFLLHEFKSLGIDFPNGWRCTLKLIRRLYPYFPVHTLDTVYKYLFSGIANDINRHRFLDDARLTAGLWLRMTDNEGYRS